MKLEMKDLPGQLVTALQPISELGGNIIAVIHHRDPRSDGQTISVQIVVEISEPRLNELISRFRERGVKIPTCFV